ncbi:hypothetical protein THOM_0631, partial [Trachipleistophora hominis]
VVEQVETPSIKGKLNDVFEYFITSLFYDLLVGEFSNKVVCMTRANENDVNVSVLISGLEYEEANEILKRPSLLVQKYVFENMDIETEIQTKNVKEEVVDDNVTNNDNRGINCTESDVVDEKEEPFDENDSCADKENMNVSVEKENYGNIASKRRIEEKKIEQNEGECIHDVKGENEIENEVNESHTIEMRASDENRKDKNKKSVFRKVQDKLKSWLKKEKEEVHETEWEGDPGYLIFGSKSGHRVIITKKIKLEKCFSFDTKKDLEILDDLITDEHFYVEIQSRVKVFIVKEDDMRIFMNANVSSDQEEFLENVENLGKKMEKVKAKRNSEIKSVNN